MAIGVRTDFKIYDEQYYGGQLESIDQNIRAFNEATQGALVLSSEFVKGDYEKVSFLKNADIIGRRQPTVTTAATAIALAQDEHIDVKLHRKIGPVDQTLNSWYAIGSTPEEMSFKVGRMIGEQKVREMVNTGIRAAEAAIRGQGAALNFTISGDDKSLRHQHLVKGMAKMGDQAANIVCWVTHSKPWFDLVGNAITDKIFGVANIAVYEGTTATLGKPVLVIDSPPLFVEGDPEEEPPVSDTYNVLGLVPGAVRVKESERETLVTRVVDGLENLVGRIQGEYAYNIGVHGFKYNTATGVNPTDAAIGTSTNWVKVMASHKHLAGVRIVAE